MKREAIARVDADVVVLTEASRPKPEDAGVLWFGEPADRYGVAMLARPPFAVRALASSGAAPCVYPASVQGPVCFTLFGVWTRPVPTYLKAFESAIECHRGLPGPRVVAGDFNGNIDFDRPRSRRKWADCFKRLNEEGLVSAYHRDSPFGRERDATHYFRWKEDQPFHLDYCFVPRTWRIVSVDVGSFSEWASLSDHRPVTVELQAV